MRMGLFLLMGFLVPLECLGMEFLHKDTVLMTDIDGNTTGRLGWAAAVNHGAVFMGAPELNSQKGASYQYQINNQRQLDFVRELEPQAVNPSRYGVTIVAQGELTAVGYSHIDGIEIYKLESGIWELVKLIVLPAIDNVVIRNFGEFIDLEGDFLVVGDWSANVGGVGNAGVVMIFGRNVGGADNWGLVTHFLDPTTPPDARFATSVAISSDLMVVADNVTERVLLYTRSGSMWSYHKELQPLDSEAEDGFAASVEAEGDFVAVGATNGNDDAAAPSNAGSVHIFSRNEGSNNNFGQIAQITPSVPEFIDRFGESLRLRQDLLVVGAPGGQQVYVFSRLSGNWTEEQQILPPEGLDFKNAEFGFDVDYDHGSIVVGSNRWPDNIDGDRFGAVFLYEDPGIVLCGHLDGVFCDGYESD
jgi:hypothetical protein